MYVILTRRAASFIERENNDDISTRHKTHHGPLVHFFYRISHTVLLCEGGEGLLCDQRDLPMCESSTVVKKIVLLGYHLVGDDTCVS